MRTMDFLCACNRSIYLADIFLTHARQLRVTYLSEAASIARGYIVWRESGKHVHVYILYLVRFLSMKHFFCIILIYNHGFKSRF